LDCEICGNPVFGKGYHVNVDGAELLVCKACSTVRASPQKLRPMTNQPPSRVIAAKSGPSVPRHRPSQPTMPEGRELIPNYGEVIRKAREAMRLSQEDLGRKIAEKTSVLQKLESGRLVPPEALVEKLQRTLKIKLLLATTDASVDEKPPKPDELTLGDIAIVRTRQREAGDTEERRH